MYASQVCISLISTEVLKLSVNCAQQVGRVGNAVYEVLVLSVEIEHFLQKMALQPACSVILVRLR